MVRPAQARFSIHFRQAAPALFTWTVVLSGISILFKFLIIQEVYYDGFLVAFDVLFERQERLVGVFLLPVIFSRDVLECFLIVSGLFLLCRHLFRRDFNFPLLIALPLLLILAGANYISFRELRTGLTADNFTIAAAWAMVDPDILKLYLLKRNFIMAATVVLWSFYPYFLIRYRNAHDKGTKRYLALACLAWVIPMIVALGLFALANLALARQWWWAIALLVLAAICASCHFHGTRSPVRKSSDQPSVAWAAALLALAVASLVYTIAGSIMLATPPFYYSGHWTMIGASILQLEDDSKAGSITVPSRQSLAALYRDLVFPDGLGPPHGTLGKASIDAPKPRHIVIVSLETAIRRYYPILNNPGLPTFQRMSQNAITSELHHTTSPITAEAGFSILAGLYPPLKSDYNFLAPDSLPALLSDHDYDTIYIDSGQLDWRADDRHSRIFKSTGLDQQIDANRVPQLLEGKREFEGKLALEKWAFKLAEESIFAAESRGRKAMVYLQTTLGHFPWPASRANEHLNAVEKLIGIASELDRLFDGLLTSLQDGGLGENVIVVVTGDHGLRYRGEFESLGLRLSLRDVAFNVPLLIYAPGLIKEQIAIPYLTSHIDLAPTILELVGVPTDDPLHHGMSVLDPRLASRVTFMMNGKVTPVNGYHWGGLYFTVNELTSTSLVSEDFSGPANAAPPLGHEKDLQIPLGLTQPSGVIADAQRMIGLTYAYLGDRRFGAMNRE